MSKIADHWAWEQDKDITTGQKMVLMALANIHNPDTNLCQPTIAKLEQKCILSRRGVVLILKQLEEKGFIKTIAKFNQNGLQIANQYILLLHGPDTAYLDEVPIDPRDLEETENVSSSVNRIMTACGFKDKKVAKALVDIISVKQKENPIKKIEDQLISSWKNYMQVKSFLRYVWGPVKFFSLGYWEFEVNWPVDEERLRIKKEAQVGIYRPRPM